MAKITDASKILRNRLGDTSDLNDLVATEKLNVYVAQMIRTARTDAGLSQQELADLVGTQQQSIARLEDADYEGHSLSMLQRIAEALGKRLSLAFVEESA